jgi:hypothetical protein
MLREYDSVEKAIRKTTKQVERSGARESVFRAQSTEIQQYAYCCVRSMTQQVRAPHEYVLREVDEAVAGRLGPDVRAAPVEALAGEDARELVAQAFVLAKQVADDLQICMLNARTSTGEHRVA